MDIQKVALVSGNKDDLGEAICHRLAGAGYRVIAAVAPPEMKPGRPGDLRHPDDDGIFRCAVEFADAASCSAKVMEIVRAMGRIDVLVNRPILTRDAMFRDMSVQDWRTVIANDLDGVFNMTRAVLHGMLEGRWGRIVNISSLGGQAGAPAQVNYVAAIAGMHGFTQALAQEVAAKGITVNTVSPGRLREAARAASSYSESSVPALADIPVGRLGEPAEVAALVAYLCSDDAGYVTGANIAINGGQYMY